MNNSYSTSGNDQFYKQQINQKDSKIGEQTKIIQDLQKKLQDKVNNLQQADQQVYDLQQ